MARTNLYGFSKGAKQIVNYLNGELITKKQYEKEKENINKMFPEIKKGSEEYYELTDEGRAEIDRIYNELDNRAGVALHRKKISENYVAFLNYTKQLLELNSRKEKGITYREINQLAANNRAIKDLTLNGSKHFKYGLQSANALDKYQKIIMDNDYKKLQYIKQFPPERLKRISLKDINNVSLPLSENGRESDYNRLKHEIGKLAKRLDELDKNRHVNSIDFRRMKAAVKALNKELENPHKAANNVGEYLEAVQETSMDYVQAKGVGRQSTQLGKDRMDLGLDLAAVSSQFMDKFISTKRREAVEKFEKEVMKIQLTNAGICNDFTLGTVDGGSTRANIFENKELGIDKYGNKEAELDDDDDEIEEKKEDVNTNNKNLDESEMSDDEDEYEDEL